MLTIKRSCIYCLLALSISFAWTALAQNSEPWQPELLALETERLPRSPLRIALPEGLDSSVLQWLALELDDLDVSQFVQLESSPDGVIILLTPPEPLSAGTHSLRLVQYTEAGELIERGVWPLKIASAGAFAQSSLGGSIDLEGIYRFTDGDIDQAGKRAAGSGSAQIQGETANENWQAAGRLDILYDSLGVNLSQGQASSNSVVQDSGEVDIGDFILEAKSESLQAMVGHHALAYDGLLMQNFNRRGASFTATTPAKRLAATAFAMRTETISGSRNGFGAGDHNHRVSGGVLSVKPVPGNEQALTVSATYLTGEGQDQFGYSTGGDELEVDGDGWSLAAESYLVHNKIRIRAEYAESGFDFDGRGDGFEREGDEATSVLLQFSPWAGSLWKEQAVVFDFGLEYQKIGLFFHSLANPGLPSDRELLRPFALLQWGGMALQLSLGREKDNVDSLNDIPRLTNELSTLTASYSPLLAMDDAGNIDYGFFGQPSFSLSMQYNDQFNTSVPVDYFATAIEQRIDFSHFTANFLYPWWSWNIGYGSGWSKDFSDLSPDQRNRITDFGLNFQVGERLLLATLLQYNSILEHELAVSSRYVLGNLNAEWIMIPGKLHSTLNFSLNDEQRSDDTYHSITETIGFSLNWTLRQALDNRPGLALWLRGEYQDFDDKLADENDTRPYQVFVGVSIAWPVSYPRQ